MAMREKRTFSGDDLSALSDQRYSHPDPKVQQRFEALWLISQGETQKRPGQLAGVSQATVERNVSLFRTKGLAGLRKFHWVKPVSDLERHRPSLEESFLQAPPHTVAEACRRIEEMTGVKREETPMRAFLKKCSG